MKTIDMKIQVFDYVHDCYVTQFRTFAVNKNGQGLFTLRSDGTWQQHTGTCQFSAKSPAKLAQKIRAYCDDWSTAKMVRGSADGWRK